MDGGGRLAQPLTRAGPSGAEEAAPAARAHARPPRRKRPERQRSGFYGRRVQRWAASVFHCHPPRGAGIAASVLIVAAALAGMSTACGKEPSKNPEPCLSVPIQQPPCLSPVAQPPPDAGPDASETPEDAGAPLPCLSVAAPREDAGAPKPCLKIAPPTTQTARPHPTPLPLPCLTPKRWEDGQK